MIMCKLMEDRIKEQMIRVAIALLKTGNTPKEDIAEATGLSIETINELDNELKGVPA